jgi:uncharacterized membrane protein
VSFGDWNDREILKMAKNISTTRYSVLTRCLAALALMFVYVVSTSAVLVGASTTSAQARGRGGGGRGGGGFRGGGFRGGGFGRGRGWGRGRGIYRGGGCHFSYRWGRYVCY